MKINDSSDNEAKIKEIECVIEEFKEKFRAGTSNAENFITMGVIEHMWSELRSKTDNIYTDMLHELLNSVDEKELIVKKKENMQKKE